MRIAACQNGRYGYNCTLTCREDVCYGSDVCNKKTGACLEGCLYEGVQSPMCDQGMW